MRKHSNNIVYRISLGVSGVIVLYALLFGESFLQLSNNIFAFLTENFSWLYLLAMMLFVIFVVYVACSKWGNLKLGADDSKPEYSTLSWFAMLFCAGMGVGLVFWGISEPVTHFINPNGVEGGTVEAVEFAFKSVFMHWGIHPWANYAIIGLALAYFQFRKNKPGLISSILEPLVGEKATKGWVGKTVDCLASFATVAGVVTSLGLGVLQITSGLNFLFDVPNTLVVQILIICAITAIFLWSALSGIGKGVKFLSNLNLIVVVALMIVVFAIGPKLEMIHNLLNGLGAYLSSIVQESLSITAYGDNSWTMSWRVFYWAWWIAWAPFVGIFIARISKGRTVREFIVGVVLAPTLASVIWFAIFGTLGIDLGIKGVLSAVELQQVAAVPESGLFMVLRQYPLGVILSIIALVLLCCFFITSADSGTFVLAMLSSNGAMNPPNSRKVVWGIVQGSLAIGLLVVGGLKPLQTISIAAAFPFIFIMIAGCLSLIKAFRNDRPIK